MGGWVYGRRGAINPGIRRGYPDGAYASCRVPFRIPVAEGLLDFVISLLSLSLRVPDHITLSRRTATLGEAAASYSAGMAATWGS